MPIFPGTNGGKMIGISVVVPVYAGEAYVEQLTADIESLRHSFRASRGDISLNELIFVDDGARDNSPALLDRIAVTRDWVRVLHLSRNFGQHAATIAGISHSSGDWIVTLDEDLQHPPARIVDMLRKAAETGSDVVYAKPTGTVHQKLARDLSSRAYKRMMEWITGNANLRRVNSFRLLRGSVGREAARVSQHDTYFDVTLSWFTGRIATAPMSLKDERYIGTGKSGYGFRSLLSHGRRMIASSQLKVLRLGVLFGLVVAGVSVVGSIALILIRLLMPQLIAIQGWASQMLAITFFGGFCIFLLGILLEYMSIMVMRSNGRPLFFVVDRSSDEQLRVLLTPDFPTAAERENRPA